MADRPVLIDFGGPAEQLEYQLGAGESFRPETVTASVDGSGAAAEFVPQLSLYAQSGQLLARTRTDDSVAAGSSGVATFAPF